MFDPEYRQFLKLFYVFKSPDQIKKYFYCKNRNEITKTRYEIRISKIDIIYDNDYIKEKFIVRLSDGFLRFGHELKDFNLFSLLYKQLKSL